ncbi:MAG: 2-oxoglutarate and iron-dependent oxygenase domain-containing protein [Acetobacteraceae bacterium]|jgi:isopenicillin N synthase-like dioxygenase
MHLFKQHAVKDFAEAAATIPVIDYGPYFAGEPGALERLAEDVRYACENIGFFYALNHGVPRDVIDRGFAASRRFHALPLETKLMLRLNENNIGYMPMNASVQGASQVHKATKPNQNESFFISHDRGSDHPDVLAGIPLRGRNQWPDGLPGLRDDMMAYFQALRAMCDRMLPPFAAALDMPADFFAPYFADEGHANLRFLHYPPQQDMSENTFGTAPHTDNSFMTALARTDVPGLAIRLPTGEWFPPPVIPGTFLINLGNIMRRWSNDRFLSTPHGVINESGADRYSIAYFHSPDPASTIECLPSCVSADNPPHYPPALYRDLVLAFYRANYFHQQGHKSEAAALAGAAD